MIFTSFRDDIPEWARPYMLMTCPYCHSLILDNSDTGATTARWCANTKCPEHMAHKMKILANYYGVKGFGVSAARTYIEIHHCSSHLEILESWFSEKPEESLAVIATLACIENLGSTKAKNLFSTYNSFEDYFASTNNPDTVALENKQLLIDSQNYFRIKPALSSTIIRVMGTGSFHGYSNRTQYFDMINKIFGKYAQVLEVGKRKTGVAFLLKEKDAIDHSKSQIAKECNIPIITPTEFIAALMHHFHISIEDFNKIKMAGTTETTEL